MRTYEPGQVQEALKCLKTVTPNNNFYHLNVWLQTKQKLNKRSERGSGAHGEVSSAQWIRIGSVYVVTKTHHPCITCVKPEISKRNYTVHSLHSPNRATHFETCVSDVTDKIRFATPSHWRWLWCVVPVMRSLLKCEYVGVIFLPFHGCILIDPFFTHLATSNEGVIILTKSQQKITW